jgi:hypothetical protein
VRASLAIVLITDAFGREAARAGIIAAFEDFAAGEPNPPWVNS